MVTDSFAAEVSLLYHRTEQERDPDRFILKHLVLQSTEPLPAELLPREYLERSWTFEFVSNKTDFCLCVHIEIAPKSSLRWMVLPVAGWGLKYYVVTFHYAPSITITAAENSTVYITLKYSTSVTAKAAKSANNSYLTVPLERNQAMHLAICENIETALGSFIGTYVQSIKPIGVVHGTCYQYYPNVKDCRKPNKEQLAIGRQEMVSDMAPPVESYGREFITLPMSVSRLARYMALASESFTTVNVSSTTTITLLENAGDFNYIVVNFMPTKISSSKAILLVLVASSLCNKIYLSDVSPALVYIVPVNLYYFDYILCATWTRVKGKSSWLFTSIPLNATPTCQQAFMTANGRFGCYMYGFNISTRHTGFLLPVGYISSPINTPCQASIPVIGDLEDNDCDMNIDEEWMDGKDNDNDGRTDEDVGVNHGFWGKWTSWTCSKNCSDANIYRYRACDNPAPSIRGRDCSGMTSETRPELCHQSKPCPGVTSTAAIDKTKLVSTGKRTPAITTYAKTLNTTTSYEDVDYWTSWSQWSCSQVDCTDTRLFQIRSCNHSSNTTCVGDDVQYKNAWCYINDTCPKDCPVGTWGLNCKKQCRNCDPDCDKFNGTCKLCQPGFQYPNTSCSSECSPMRYGFNCREDCYLKCKTDCKEKVTGICPSGLSQFLPMFLLIPIIPLTVLFLLGKKMSLSEKDENSSDGLNLTITGEL
ncbi:uncharacterized protein LOC106060304 isoform X3 [Biomphalaria glabrata]|uniref:Uncharacterized protein LOC106060304 isoform X3 n=1 Tax=Biomphalaria glabrata TaxID=6526 RepID=A0A9W2ZE64_BIOGL|nr:uncharacterized protein LOC106060304 isoform X3 [Biomphalaria glabrata]